MGPAPYFRVMATIGLGLKMYAIILPSNDLISVHIHNYDAEKVKQTTTQLSVNVNNHGYIYCRSPNTFKCIQHRHKIYNMS